MKKLVLLIAILSGACTDEDGARRALEGAGYTHIDFTGHALGRCSDSDGSCTGFTAMGPSGQRVTGAVGCGYSCKGCTIRTY